MEHAHVVFVGGGLASGLAAYRLSQLRPGTRVMVLEREPVLGGAHTWSFHGSDLTSSQFAWVAPFISKSWSVYSVQFPKYGRDLQSSYHSIRSEDFHRRLSEFLKGSLVLGARVSQVKKDHVVLDSGARITADCVIDARGWDPGTPGRFAYQKFLGQTVQLKHPHGLQGPVVMDANCTQDDGYRFFYALPWTERSVLIEDTHYSNTPELDAELYRKEIAAYCGTRGWQVESVGYEEVGSLVIPLEGRLPSADGEVPRLGVRGGFFHATTGYSVPNAVRCAEKIAAHRALDSASIHLLLRREAEAVWRNGAYFRFLNRLLFDACPPEKRYVILQNFYRLPQGLIRRFYAGRMHPWDKVRLFLGKPPLPVRDALTVALRRNKFART